MLVIANRFFDAELDDFHRRICGIEKRFSFGLALTGTARNLWTERDPAAIKLVSLDHETQPVQSGGVLTVRSHHRSLVVVPNSVYAHRSLPVERRCGDRSAFAALADPPANTVSAFDGDPSVSAQVLDGCAKAQGRRSPRCRARYWAAAQRPRVGDPRRSVKGSCSVGDADPGPTFAQRTVTAGRVCGSRRAMRPNPAWPEPAAPRQSADRVRLGRQSQQTRRRRTRSRSAGGTGDRRGSHCQC